MSMPVARDEPPPDATERQHGESASSEVDATISDFRQAKNHSAAESRRLVLIAEDHEAMRESLAEIMRGQGYLVLEAQDGQEALGVLLDRPVDVLILDLAMPRMDGMELLRQIDPPPPVVIIYSAFEYYTPDEVQSQVGSKVFRSLQKPVAPVHLVSAVADAIEELDRFNDK